MPRRPRRNHTPILIRAMSGCLWTSPLPVTVIDGSAAGGGLTVSARDVVLNGMEHQHRISSVDFCIMTVSGESALPRL